MSDEFKTPRSRNEAILQNIIGAENELVEPQSRIEAILQAILNNGTYDKEPRSRIEAILIKILNGESYDGEAKSRNEEILKAIANNGTYDKEPRSRIEELLIAWLNYGVLTVKTGAIVSISNALAKNVVSLVVDIEPVQSGTGEPSPDNVRPITGHDSVSVVRCGRNILDLTTIHQGAFDVPGNLLNVATDYIPIAGGQTYMWSQSASVPGRYLRFYDKNKTQIGWQNQYSTTNATFTTIEGTCYMRLMWYKAQGLTPQDVIALNPQIELGSTATTYEAYHGNTYDINLPSTVYAGTLDVTTGVLMVTHGIVDMGTLSWAYNQLYNFLTANLSGKVKGAANLIMDTYAYGNVWSASSDFVMAGNGSNDTVYVKDSRYTDGQAFKLAMSGHYTVYELATPLTYQLTPTAIELFEDNNTIWSSDGAITLTYYAKKEA